MNANLMTLLQQNRMTEAKVLCAKLCAENPSDAQIQFLMSAICGQLGDFAESETFSSRAAKLNPNVPEIWYNLAIAQLRLGKNTAAIDSLKNALKLRAAFPEALNELGNAYQRTGDHAAAIVQHERAIQLKPNFSQAYHNLASAHLASEDPSAAERNLRIAIDLNPRLAEARLSLGKIHLQKGNNKLALEQFEAIFAHAPVDADHLITIASALKEAKLLTDADRHYKKALSILPNNAKLLSNYGLTLTELRRTDEAIATLTRATAIDPSMAEGFYNLAIAQRAANQQEAAEKSYLHALSLRRDFPEAWLNLGTLRLIQGRVPEARECFNQALDQHPDYHEAASDLLMALNYDETYSAEDIYQQHFRWGAEFTAQSHEKPHHPAQSTRSGNNLRIGFVSPDYRTHSVAYFFQSLLEPERKDIEIFCYSNTERTDETTHRIRNMVTGWREIAHLDDFAAAQVIQGDHLDILIDLAGHTSGNRLGIFVLKPCPVQMSYLGYPNTTGLSTIDYRITDIVADPESSAQGYTEKLLRMTRCFLCYTPKPGIPEPRPIETTTKRPINFGSFNNLAKLTPDVVALWSKILTDTPDSTLTLKAGPLSDSSVANRLQAMFQQHGIEPDRLKLIGWLPDAEHFLAYNQIDIALDTHPYNGTTTTCEALWMGRPVVTLCGDVHASRVGASLLTAAGLTRLITRSPEEYAHTAIRLAMELLSPDHEFQDIRARMQASSLCDQTDFQKHFFDLIENAVAASTST